MRRLFFTVLVLAALWCAWWLSAAWGFETGINQWFEQRRAENWQAEAQKVTVSGFPLSVDTMIENPSLADPQTGVAFSASSLHFNVPAWWPGHVTLHLPADEMNFASPLTSHTLQAENAIATLRLQPKAELELDQMGLTADAWELSGPDGSIVSARSLNLDMEQHETQRTRYAFTADAPQFQPGALVRQTLRIPDDWPVTFDALALDMTVNFDRPIDRTTIEENRPQPRAIDLRLAEAQWGTLSVRMAATLGVAEGGVLNGEVSLQAQNWQIMLNLAESAGTLPSALRPQIENILSALARSGGNPETIDVTFELRDGRAFLGFIPLGPAPRLILR
ncbi:MAG: DUF2125 domain-containing protein [Pseudomonadota bacterium]